MDLELAGNFGWANESSIDHRDLKLEKHMQKENRKICKHLQTKPHTSGSCQRLGKSSQEKDIH